MSSLLALLQAVDAAPLLRARIDLDYPNRRGALKGVALAIAPGEILGLIGESGSGKSSIAMALLRLLGRGARLSGAVDFDGRDLLSLPERDMRRVRGREIGLVLQSPLAALNPVLRIGAQLRETWRAHRKDPGEEEIRRVLEMVSLPGTAEFLRLYPRQLSVGLAQRVLIAMAILHRPKLLIADEPTSALDVITAAEILKLFADLRTQLGMAMLFISHDLLSVASLCDRVAILRSGEMVECAETAEVFGNPQHEYTRALVAALPRTPKFRTATLAGVPDRSVSVAAVHMTARRGAAE